MVIGDSDAATTTKPTSHALKCIQAFNKSGNIEDTNKTITGGDSSNYRSDRRKFVLRGKQKGDTSGGLVSNSSRCTQSSGVGKDTNTGRGNPIRSTRSGRVGTDTNTGRGGVSNSASQSTQSGRRGTVGTDTNTGRNTQSGCRGIVDTDTNTGRGGSNKKTPTYHNSNMELSPSSSSSSSKSLSSKSSKGSKYEDTSSDDDDDDDDDYVDKGGKKKQKSGTKKDDRMKKRGKKEAVESLEVLKAAKFPLTLRVAFLPRKRSNSTAPSAFNTISNGDYAYHKYTSGLTTSSTLIEVQKEIESFLPSDLSLVVGKALFFDSSFKSIHPENYGVISKSKSKHVDPITDDNELLNAISCGGLKLKTTSEPTEEPKIIDMLETIDEEEEEEEEGGGEEGSDEDECNNDSRFYYHLDLIVFCEQEKNTNGPKKKASTDAAEKRNEQHHNRQVVKGCKFFSGCILTRIVPTTTFFHSSYGLQSFMNTVLILRNDV